MSAVGAPSRDARVRPSWKAWCFIFITQHAPWRRPAGCRALQNLSTWELKELAHSVAALGSSAGGPYRSLQGP